MALATENANLVWQKVRAALADANPAVQEMFKDLKLYLASQKYNPNLQFIPFSEAQAIANLGTSLVGGACTLYAVYVKAARTSGTTAAFFAIHDAADNAATTTTIITNRIKATAQFYANVMPHGIAIATDVVVSCATAVGGATESTTPDGVNGFVIVG